MLAEQRRYDYAEVPNYQEQKQPKKKQRIVIVTRKKAIMRMKAVIAIVFFFVLGTFILLRYAQINQGNREVYNLKSEYNKVFGTNAQIKVGLNKKVDLNEIEKSAIEKLGMQYPDKNQTIYVEVAKRDFTEIPVEQEKTQGSGGVFASISGELLRYLY